MSSTLAIGSQVGPIIWPVHLLGLPKRKDRLDGEGHAGLADADSLVLGIVGDPRRRVKLSVDAVTTPGGDDTEAPRLSMRLDDLAKVAQSAPGLDHGNSQIQALSCCFHHLDGVWVFCSFAYVVGFVEISVVAPVVERDVKVDNVAVEEDPLVGDSMADDLVDGDAYRLGKVIVVERGWISLGEGYCEVRGRDAWFPLRR